MKILFICGSLENGRDGVGDYTRRLAGEIIRQGHSASIIALNDKHISVIEQTEQESDGTKISVLRLPSILSNKEKHRKAENFIKEFNPEWLSLQFVPYSFNKRGLPFGLAKQLKKLGKGRKWHIMFHELGGWHCKNSNIKIIIKGIVQQYILQHLVKELRPIIHTNIKWRVSRLKLWNIDAKLLPLFGNIPVKYEKSLKNNSDIIFIVFGSIFSGGNIIGFSQWLANLDSIENKKVIVWFVGKNGNELDFWVKNIQNKNIEYKIFGMQDEDTISKLMSESDVGISTTPYYFAEKSGSVAAMIEHDLPVICVGREMIPRKIDLTSYTNNVLEWQPDLQLKDILNQKIKTYDLHKVTDLFINDLKNV